MLDREKMLSEEEISKVSGGTGELGRVPHIDTYNCIHCWMCTSKCDQDAISELNGDPSITSACNGCGACINSCPIHAIH